MQSASAVRKEGPRAPLFACVILAASTASAQDVVERGELERCAALDNDAAKLACFEALARVPGVAATDVAVDVAPVAEVAEVAEDSELPETSVPPVPSAPGAEPATAATVPATTADAAVPAEATVAATADTPPAAAPADLGSEYLAREEPSEPTEPELVTATVNEVWRSGNRLLFFRFDNGQVWRQMESSYFYYPRNESFDVTIRQSFMGDYQMRVEGRSRMTRIVRVE